MITTREPYELLVRWVPAGLPENQYSGTVQAQINFAYVARDEEGVVQSWTPDQKGPFHVSMNGDNGIDLEQFLPQLNAAALIELAQVKTELQTLQNDGGE